MLIEIGLMFGAYFGAKVYEKYKKEKAYEPVKEQKTDVEDPDSEFTDLPAAPGPGEEADDPVKFNEQYAKVSLASMGLFGLGKLFPPLIPLGLASYIYGAIPYIKDVEDKLVRDRQVNVDVLFFIADVLTLAVSRYVAAGFGLFLRYSGKTGVERAKDHSRKMITDVFSQLPQKVWVLTDNVEVEIPLDDVKANDTVLVDPGSVIPVDGLVTEGMASVDQQALTGEAQPAEKEPGDHVYANTIVLTGRIHIRVEKSGEETTASKISRILAHATDFKSKVQLKGEEWADKSTLPMTVASALVLPVIGPVNTAVFINSHMGNRIRLVSPLETLGHVTMAAHKGVLVKDGRALEGLHEVDTILFDKTGTLTTGEPEVTKIISRSHYTGDQILCFAASAEDKQTHPVARAILKKAGEANLTIQTVHDSKYQIGYGITVLTEDKVIKVGSIRFITSEGIPIPETMEEVIEASHEKGNTLIMVAVDNQVEGVIELQPRVRPEAKEIIGQLRRFGIGHIAIVSGDHRHPTQKLAEDLGADGYYHNVLPEAKAEIVGQLQKEKKNVCFVGDGINDAIAMKQADVSISLAGATTIATDVAEIIFMDGGLACLCDVFNISKELDGNLKKDLKLTIAPGIINLGNAFIFHFGIMSSLLINASFSMAGMKNVLKSPKAPKRIELREQAVAEKKGS
ncbi:MAG: heavy metal translocating P-type ATPase [bacterium]|nr:heavy metal translocating P-type ATPase [bacterium]